MSILNWNKLLHSSVSFYLYPFLPTFKFHFRIFAYFEYHFSVFANFIFANFRFERLATDIALCGLQVKSAGLVALQDFCSRCLLVIPGVEIEKSEAYIYKCRQFI